MPYDTVPTVELTGPAVTGFEPPPQVRAVVSELSRTVRLGRRRPRTRPSVPRLAAFLDLERAAPPPTLNYRAKAAKSIAHMYLNDQYGDCVFAGKAHNLGVWSANDPDSGGEVIATDAEIKKQYFDYTGGQDNGAIISEVLDIMKARGFVAGGKAYKIDGYVEADWTRPDEIKAAQWLFGTTCIGINLPEAWTSDSIWDVTNTRIVGGHDVSPIDYDDRGVYVSSWGRIYLITWAAFTSRKWLEEYYVPLAPLWYNNDQLAPNGVNVTQLKTALDQLGGGVIPNVDPTPPPDPGPGPTPTPPPTPPGPLPGMTHKIGVIWNGNQVSGTVTFPEGATKGTVTAFASRTSGAGSDSNLQLAAQELAAQLEAKYGAGVNWMVVLFDVIALIGAWQSRNVQAIIAAAIQLLTDLGIRVPPLGSESFTGTSFAGPLPE